MESTLPNLSMRLAGRQDSKYIWQWRNDEQTRAMSINTEYVEFAQHCAWYDKELDSDTSVVLIAFLSDTSTRVGMVRFDSRLDSALAEVSINLNPDFRGLGLSSAVLSLAIAKFLPEGIKTVVAKVKLENTPSQALFEKMGFVRYEPIKGISLFKMGLND